MFLSDPVVLPVVSLPNPENFEDRPRQSSRRIEDSHFPLRILQSRKAAARYEIEVYRSVVPNRPLAKRVSRPPFNDYAGGRDGL